MYIWYSVKRNHNNPPTNNFTYLSIQIRSKTKSIRYTLWMHSMWFMMILLFTREDASYTLQNVLMSVTCYDYKQVRWVWLIDLIDWVNYTWLNSEWCTYPCIIFELRHFPRQISLKLLKLIYKSPLSKLQKPHIWTTDRYYSFSK